MSDNEVLQIGIKSRGYREQDCYRIMSTADYIYPIIVPSDSNVEDAFSSTNTPNYTPASPNYSPASPRNTSPDPRDFDQLETELQEARTQIAGFQRKQMGHDDEIVLARVKTSTLEILIEDIQVRHRSDMKSLLDKIRELKNYKGGPPDY
ncbi:hypothetical protein Tco_0845499 [Tanacetum coccineum]